MRTNVADLMLLKFERSYDKDADPIDTDAVHHHAAMVIQVAFRNFLEFKRNAASVEARKRWAIIKHSLTLGTAI